MPPLVALLTDLWPSRSQPYAGSFVSASVRAVGDCARFVVLTPRLVGSRVHRSIWGDGPQGWQRGWEPPPAPSVLVSYPVARLPKAGEAAVRAVGARFALRRAGKRPMIVHSHFLHEVGVAGDRLARSLGVPAVITVHGTDARWLFEGGIQQRHRDAMLAAARRADRLLVVNNAMAAGFQERGVERVEVMPMGVDEEVFRIRDRAAARAELGLRGTDPLVLFVGRPTREKGFELLAQAAARLPDARFVAAGPPVPDARVEGLGVLPPERLALWLSAANVLCLPSYAEGTPVAVTEALASGIPVVATAVGGVPDQLSEDTGVLVELGDDVALTQAIGQALTADWDAETIRRSSRPFWWSELGPRLARLYEDLA